MFMYIPTRCCYYFKAPCSTALSLYYWPLCSVASLQPLARLSASPPTLAVHSAAFFFACSFVSGLIIIVVILFHGFIPLGLVEHKVLVVVLQHFHRALQVHEQ